MVATTGVVGAGFRMKLLPMSTAGASLKTGIRNGKFHGVIPTTTPSGLWWTSIR
jgi:hypothetical protein